MKIQEKGMSMQQSDKVLLKVNIYPPQNSWWRRPSEGNCIGLFQDRRRSKKATLSGYGSQNVDSYVFASFLP